MKKSRYNEEQIVFALKQAELGTKVEEFADGIAALPTCPPNHCRAARRRAVAWQSFQSILLPMRRVLRRFESIIDC